MKLELKKKDAPTPIEVKVDDGSFKLLVRQPSYKELLHLLGLSMQNKNEEFNLAATNLIVGWEDLLDEEGKAIPFSRETLEILLENHALLIYQVFSEIYLFVHKVGTYDPKKSEKQ